MPKISVPSIEALAAWREIQPSAYRFVYLLLFGIASGRFDAGLNETLNEAMTRLADTKSDLAVCRHFAPSPSLSQFADLINELRQAIDLYGEMQVLEQGLLQAAGSDKELIFPDQVCRAVSTWKTASNQAIVFDNNLDSLPFYLAAEGKKTVVCSVALSVKSYWNLAGKATGLPLSGVACCYEEIGTFREKLPEEADSYLLGPIGVELRNPGKVARHDALAFLLSCILPRMKGRIAVMSASSLAFNSNRGFHDLRRMLADSQRLGYVAAFPVGLLEWAGISTLGLFIEAASEKGNVVRFADFSDEALYAQSNRRRRRVLNERGLAAIDALLTMRQVDMPVAEASTDRLLADPEVCLAPQNYLLELTDGNDLKQLESFPFRLGDIAEVIRPMLRRPAENGVPVREVGASDITAFGRVVEPQEVVFVEASKASEAFRRTILRRNDIVFCVKGSVARCGLVVDEPSEGWTIGQMCVGIRLKPDAPISAVALWRYLRMESFGKYLKKVVPALALQARIVFMSAKDVENFPVPKLSAEQQSREEAIFAEQEIQLRKIKELEKAVAAAEPKEMPRDWQ